MGVVEGAADVDGVVVVGPEAEALVHPRGEGRAGEHHRPSVPQALAQQVGDVERGDAQPGVGVGTLDPRHRPFGDVRGERHVGLEVAGELHGAVLAVLDVVRRAVGDLPQGGGQAVQPAPHERQRVLDLRVGGALESAADVIRERGGQGAARAFDLIHRSRVVEDRPHRAGQVVEAPCGELEPAGVRDDVLELVRLVDHHQIVLGEDGAVGAEVESQQVEVHHGHVGLAGLASRCLGEARVARRALAGAGALLCRHADRAPRLVRRLDG